MSAAADDLAARVRRQIGLLPNVTEKRMFGGIAFLFDGNMVVAVTREGGLLARTGRENYDAALERLGAGPVTMGTRRMGGFVYVEGEGIETESGLREWLELGLGVASRLPPKSK